MQTEPGNGWIQWAGGDRPVEGHTTVAVRLRGGEKCTDTAGYLSWVHILGDAGQDIIAYRVVSA